MPETLTTTRGCQKVLPEGDARVRTRYYCDAPARWLCVDNRQRYCDEHAHDDEACCQLVEIGVPA